MSDDAPRDSANRMPPPGKMTVHTVHDPWTHAFKAWNLETREVGIILTTPQRRPSGHRWSWKLRRFRSWHPKEKAG